MLPSTSHPDPETEWRKCRVVSLDFETTGTDRRQDRIIEVGMAVFEGGEVIDRWGSLIDPGVPLPEEITRVTGIQPEDLIGKPPIGQIIEEVLARLGDSVILAYNHEFDLGMLASELERLGIEHALPPCLDPFPFCWEHLRERGLTPDAKLGTVASYLGVPLVSAHRATDDAEAAGRVLLALGAHVVLPERLGQLLAMQRALMQAVNEKFARFRRGRQGGTPGAAVLSQEAAPVELGSEYAWAEETDPVRYLFSRLPDLRDV